MASSRKKRSAKFRRAQLRHFFVTRGLNRLSGGRLLDRHQAESVLVRRIDITVPTWPAELDGLRIAHISDLHVGDLMSVERAIELTRLIADEQPDIVCNTGDVADLVCPELGPLFEAFVALQPPMGNFLVLGNHDELDDGERVAALAEAAGIRVLRNEQVEVVHGGRSMRIGGVDWSRAPADCRRTIDQTLRGGPIDLLLSHNPKAFDHAAEQGVPLTLSGHTHGGQIARKNKPDANLALALNHRRSAGLYEHGDSRLFVTVGAGALFPLRMNCPAEIAMLTITRS
ncbi:MAG: metallophosphoesterase [Phycisphaerales bacterium]|nr:metallophosphoesterase [Phycisphaerales bacterium]